MKFHTDPGHGWLEVPRADVVESGIRVSPYSYANKDSVFLEEDLDAGTFLGYLRSKGVAFEYENVMHNDDCFIRQLPRFSQG